MKKLLWLLLLAGFSFYACDNLVKKDNSSSETKKKKKKVEEEPSDEDEPVIRKKKPSLTEELETNSKGQVLNGIIVHENGLQLSRAYLSYESGGLVPGKNEVPLNIPVFLHLLVEKGWAVKDGKVSIGASEKIESDAGEKVIDVEDVCQYF